MRLSRCQNTYKPRETFFQADHSFLLLGPEHFQHFPHLKSYSFNHCSGGDFHQQRKRLWAWSILLSPCQYTYKPRETFFPADHSFLLLGPEHFQHFPHLKSYSCNHCSGGEFHQQRKRLWASTSSCCFLPYRDWYPAVVQVRRRKIFYKSLNSLV